MKSISTLLLSISLFFASENSIITTKVIENNLVKVSENLLANKFETTNAEYKEFIKWTEANGSAKDLEKSKVDHTGWKTLGFMPEIEGQYFEGKMFNTYPVVNISYEGAVKYCEWLTEKYNSTKKRKYEKLLIRLPTGKEWTSMAKAGRNNTLYPWGGPYLQNSKGDFLANFYRIGNSMIEVDIENRKSVEIHKIESRKMYMMAYPVDQYSQGPYELHSLSGNAAEMVAEKGSTKGGSFGSSGYYLTIDAEDEFKGFKTSPYVGFRYVAEIIEK
jgi:formylglycine-generating enzyme required for sulfatase activity